LAQKLDAIRPSATQGWSSLVGGTSSHARGGEDSTASGAVTTDLSEALGPARRGSGDLATPTPLHAREAIAAESRQSTAGRNTDADGVRCAGRCRFQKVTGLTCMVGHTRRFESLHKGIHRKHRARRDRESSKWECRNILQRPNSMHSVSRAHGRPPELAARGQLRELSPTQTGAP